MPAEDLQRSLINYDEHCRVCKGRYDDCIWCDGTNCQTVRVTPNTAPPFSAEKSADAGADAASPEASALQTQSEVIA